MDAAIGKTLSAQQLLKFGYAAAHTNRPCSVFANRLLHMVALGMLSPNAAQRLSQGASTEQNEADADHEEEEPSEDDPPEDNEKEEQLEATKRAKSLIKIIADLDTKVTGMLMQLPASKRTEALKSDMKYKRGDAIKFKKCLTTMLHMKGGFTLQELRKHIIKATECVKVLNNLVMLAKAHKKADQCPKTPPTKGCKK